jgi:hypothetical protein
MTVFWVVAPLQLRRQPSSNTVAQPFYTRGTLNIVEESWWHTNTFLHIVEGGDSLWQLLINRPQPKNILFDVYNYPSLLLSFILNIFII